MPRDHLAATAPWRRHFDIALVVVLVFGALAVVTALVMDLPLRDPDGLFGPSYVRLPLIALLMMGLDVVPRVLRRRLRAPGTVRIALEVVRERWSLPRVLVAAAGLATFYLSYVAYRNLKSFLPFVREDLTDAWLADTDRWFALGGHPGDMLHDVLGTGASADVLSFVYMIFLPFVPFSLAAALIWSDDLGRGAWYATALSFNWILGTASYYALPSLGPVYVQSWRFGDLPDTAVSGLQESLWDNRLEVIADPHATQSVHGIAAFASLHTSIVFTAALVASLSRMRLLVQYLLWAFFALTVLATVYFGWHYVLDVFAGLLVGGASVWFAAFAVRRRGLRRTAVAAPVPAVADLRR